MVEISTLIGQLTDSEAPGLRAVVMGWVIDFKLDDTDLFPQYQDRRPFAWSGTIAPDMDVYMDRLPLILVREEARPSGVSTKRSS